MIYPNFSTGYAKNRGESLYPDLWDGLVGLWSPEMGKQGDSLYDWSGFNHKATLNGMDAATDYVAGKYGYALNYDGSNDNVTTANIPEINSVAQTITVMMWVRTTGTGSQCLFSYDSNDSLSPGADLYIYGPAGINYGGFCNTSEISTGIAINDGKWHHIAVVGRQTSSEFWVDGILRLNSTGLTKKSSPGSDYTTGHTIRFADNSNISFFAGDIGEVRLYRRDLSADQIRKSYLGASPLTQSPIYPVYESPDITFLASLLSIVSSIQSPTSIIDFVLAPTVLTITSSIEASEAGNIVTFLPTVLDVLSSVVNPSLVIDTVITPTVNTLASSLLSVSFPGLNTASYATKILSFNPLLFVTDTNPAKLVHVDTTIPSVPVHTTYTLTGVTNATDIAYNANTGFLYISCADGKVVKVNTADYTDQEIIDLGDTDDLLTVETLADYGVTYVTTSNTVGELYLIDEREYAYGDMSFEAVAELNEFADLQFNIVEYASMESNCQVLSEVQEVMNCDFKCITGELDEIEPMKLSDIHVYLDSVELSNQDVRLNSIKITHNVDNDSIATFVLTRLHDYINLDKDGNVRPITNQNVVDIYFGTHLELSGRIANLDCNYGPENDEITVTVVATEKTNVYNTVNISLPGLTERLSLYHAFLNNPNIYDPYIDPDAIDPKVYKGVQVSLGEKTMQSVLQFQQFDTLGTFAEDIQDGTFVPKQNWTYFWSPTLTRYGNVSAAGIDALKKAGNPPAGVPFSTFTQPNFGLPIVNISGTNSPYFNLGTTSAQYFSYIGTSLAPVSEDLWILTNAKHRYQRQKPDIVTDLGVYTVGEAPFKEVSVKNGWFVPKAMWVDHADGLYADTAAGYDFREYAKKVADLEYQKMLNINGDILPQTSCNVTLMIDGYLYHGVSLLSRVNIDNTTQANTFKNNNGFPVAVKSITIDAATMKTTLTCDNLKSQDELDALDGLFPDEDSSEFNTPEKSEFLAQKSDLRTGLNVD